jgi:hypothetical protein
MWRARLGSVVASLWVAVLVDGTPSAVLAAVPSPPVPAATRARGNEHASAMRHVVLLDPPPVLARALSTALSPWGVRLQSIAREKPGTTLPGTALEAAELARELGASTLVWISGNTEGAALWIYDAQSDTIRARAVPRRPLDGALAAALALSVKTWLRGAEPEPEGAAPPQAAAVAREPLAREGSSVEDSVGSAAPRGAQLRVLVSAAARLGTLDGTPAGARYGAELRASASGAGTARTQLWLGARFDTGSALSVSRPTFRGSYSDPSCGVFVGLSHPLVPLLSVGLLGGAALHRASISGTLPPAASPVDTSRWLVSAQLRPELDLAIGPLGVVVQGTLGAPLRKQAYTVDGVDMVGASSLWWMLGGGLRVDIL